MQYKSKSAMTTSPIVEPLTAGNRRMEMNAGSQRAKSINYQQTIGNYIIGETIGRGSFGKVKKGHHIETGETVAIKILNREMLKTSHMDKKIRREIKVLKLFSHPNICRLYEVICTPSDMYLIMEYVGGGELYDYIVEKGRVPEDEARYLFQQIVCAVEYCHHFRVVHRDLKPENILLGPGLQVKLIDFGLSNIMRDGEFLTTSCGSPNYAAPEVISGKLYIGPEADVWSCGVILYGLLCGCLPFDESSVQILFNKIKTGTYSIPGNVPHGARELIQRILVVDPLIRLTVPQIRDQDWFNVKLPMRLTYSESLFATTDERVNSIVVNETARKLNLREKDVRRELQSGSGPAHVAYNILLDAKRRKEIAAEIKELGIGIYATHDNNKSNNRNKNNNNNNNNAFSSMNDDDDDDDDYDDDYDDDDDDDNTMRVLRNNNNKYGNSRYAGQTYNNSNSNKYNRNDNSTRRSMKKEHERHQDNSGPISAYAANTNSHYSNRFNPTSTTGVANNSIDLLSNSSAPIALNAHQSNTVAHHRSSHASFSSLGKLTRCKATDKEFNMGMMLLPSPAMEAMLDHVDATNLKSSYNANSFIPVSVQSRQLSASSSFAQSQTWSVANSSIGAHRTAMSSTALFNNNNNITTNNNSEPVPQCKSFSITRHTLHKSNPLLCSFSESLGSNHNYSRSVTANQVRSTTTINNNYVGNANNNNPNNNKNLFATTNINAMPIQVNEINASRPFGNTNTSSLSCTAPSRTVGTYTNMGAWRNERFNIGNYKYNNINNGSICSNNNNSGGNGGSYQQRNGNSISGLNNNSNNFHNKSDELPIGSVARRQELYTHEEEQFMVRHNYGWRIGIMTDGTLDRLQKNLYAVLKLYEMEWKLASPFSLRVRTTLATWPLIRQALHTHCSNEISSNVDGNELRTPRVRDSYYYNSNNNLNRNTITSTTSESPISDTEMRNEEQHENQQNSHEVDSNNKGSITCYVKQYKKEVKFIINVFRLGDRRSNGLMIDFDVCDKTLIDFEVVLCISNELVSKLG